MPNKTLVFCLVTLCSGTLAGLGQASVPVVLWEHSLGGSSNDFQLSIAQTDNRGYLLAGFSDSPSDGTKTAPRYGGSDFWVVRLDSQRQVLWDRSFGGTDDDFLQVCRVTSDGGFLLGGASLSTTNGNKESVHYGLRDYWIVRVDSEGGKLWERSFGGSNNDFFEDAIETADGGFLLGGYSFSGTDGNKTSPSYGFFDYWIVRLDPDGNKLWEHSYGGTSSDYLIRLVSRNDLGFAVGGYSLSDTNGSRTSPKIGGCDFWFLLLDTNGVKTSEAAFGGTGDEFLLGLVQTRDGGFVLGGSSASYPSGNKTSPNFGLDDFWIVRLDAGGGKLWDQSYGGTGQDVLRCMSELADGRLVLGGWSESPTNASKTGVPYGKSDYWVVGVDAEGHQQWDRSFGGEENDVLLAMACDLNADILLGGYSYSETQGSKTAPHYGGADFWLVQLTTPAVSAPVLHALVQSAETIGSVGFTLTLQGQSNRTYVLEHSSNLTDWIPLVTNVQTASEMLITDETAASREQRFYRAWIQP